MSKPHRYLGAHNKELRSLMDKARLTGWILEKSNGGHIRWVLPGKGVTFSSSTPSDFREPLNLRARLRRIERGLQASTGRTITSKEEVSC